MTIDRGTEVTWGDQTDSGTVTGVHHSDVTRTTRGDQVTRHGSPDDPAYVIEADDGTVVLKLRSEVERA